MNTNPNQTDQAAPQREPDNLNVPMSRDLMNDPKITAKILGRATELKLDESPTIQVKLVEARAKVLVDAYWEDYFRKHPIDELQAMSQYQNLKQMNGRDVFRIRQIVVQDITSATDVLQQLKNGASMEILAKEYSIDTNSRDNGGDLGWRWRSELIPPVIELIDKLEVGEYPDTPLALEHVCIVLRLDDKIQRNFPSYEQMKTVLLNSLRAQVVVAELKKMAESLDS
ncbi:MAG: peptidylprolyl isomerase [Gammaproteobacteria bacterium]|nr:peptidylprolyl isomerase [Gammaproteobacteria bacterium]